MIILIYSQTWEKFFYLLNLFHLHLVFEYHLNEEVFQKCVQETNDSGRVSNWHRFKNIKSIHIDLYELTDAFYEYGRDGPIDRDIQNYYT